MSTTPSLNEQELNFIASGGTTPLDEPTPPTVAHEPDDDTDPVQPGAQDDPPADTGSIAGEGQGGEGEPGATDPNVDRDRRVPYQALKEEREARKERDRQLAEMNEKFARADERLQMIQAQYQQQAAPAQQTQPQQPDEPAIPSVDDDLVGAIKWTQQQLVESRRQQQEAAEQTRQQQEYETQSREYTNYVAQTYKQSADEARANEPAFDDAYQHLMATRFQELMAMGHTQQSAQQQWLQDELGMAHQAIQALQNPAERVLALARARGWQPKPPAPAMAPGGQLDTVARGQEANRSLSSAGTGGTGTRKLDAKSLADMPAKEFEQLLAKDPDVVRRVMGG